MTVSRRWLAAWLALCVLWMSAVGVWHGYVHGPAFHWHAAVTEAAQETHRTDLFGTHREAGQCQLFDEACLAQVLLGSAVPEPFTAAQHVMVSVPHKTWVSPFFSAQPIRGPPVDLNFMAWVSRQTPPEVYPEAG